MTNSLQLAETLNIRANAATAMQMWAGPVNSVAFDEAGIQARLLNLGRPCFVVRDGQGRIGVTNEGDLHAAGNGIAGQMEALMSAPSLSPQQLGDPAFLAAHGLQQPYSTGAMANGIASEELVIAMGQAKMLGSFGAAGLVPERVRAAIERIQAALPNGPYAFNLIHSPSEEKLERTAVDLYLQYGVRTVEASAFLGLTPHIVRYRAAGLSVNAAGEIEIGNKVIAKISRREVATKFMQPAPAKMLQQLVSQGHITEQQANLAAQVPMADDVTVEADSGGHTDNRPLVCMLPSMIALRDEMQATYGYRRPIRVGAAGGISTPESALGAFMMGAAYIVTGSVNQGCIEAGASEHTRKLLAQAEMADVIMAPAADMFEMGVKLQVLKRGTMFPMRAQKLYELYQQYDSIDHIPATERVKLEKQAFKTSFDAVWDSCVAFFGERDPAQLERAQNNPKRKMALIFRWYLGLSSRWSNVGEQGRELDYQIWCGPSMGAFNDWVRDTYLEPHQKRQAVDVAHHILTGAAYLYRVQQLRVLGLQLPAIYGHYTPQPFAA